MRRWMMSHVEMSVFPAPGGSWSMCPKSVSTGLSEYLCAAAMKSPPPMTSWISSPLTA